MSKVLISKDEHYVLTLTQPWASLVMLGAKQYETRGWRTNYRGQLLIHAAKGMPKYCKELLREEPFASALRPWLATHGDDMALGKIIGVVDVVDCRSTTLLLKQGSISKMEEEFGDYSERRFGWLLSHPKIWNEFIPARGSLGLWKYKAVLA